MQDEVHKDVDKREQDILKSSQPAVLVIPDTVRDLEMYKKYIALKDSPSLLLPGRLIETSDINIMVDPMAHYVANTKKIAHLPSDEQDNIIKRMKSIKVLHLRIGSLREKAFGIRPKQHHPSLMRGLLDERSSELIEHFGHMQTDKEVHKIVTIEWGYQTSLASLTKFRRRNAELIEQAKDKFIKDFSSIRLSHKRGRLEELQHIYIERKMKWETSKSKDDEKMLLAVLRLLREETEDKTLRINANINQNINISIQGHIETEIMKGLTINDIILARVASRMGVNPTFLISRLHNSFYAKHSGFVRPDEDDAVTYPSMMVYNWTDIKKQHDKAGDADSELAEWEEVTEEKKQEGGDLKALLLAQINKKKEQVNLAKDRVNTKKDEQ